MRHSHRCPILQTPLVPIARRVPATFQVSHSVVGRVFPYPRHDCSICTLYVSYVMAGLRFEWDARKNAANERKHGVSFDEAATVFSDEHALLITDPDHSKEKDRFVLLGLSASLRTLVVCHCYRESEEVIRIISARKATRSERTQYNRRWES